MTDFVASVVSPRNYWWACPPSDTPSALIIVGGRCLIIEGGKGLQLRVAQVESAYGYMTFTNQASNEAQLRTVWLVLQTAF